MIIHNWSKTEMGDIVRIAIFEDNEIDRFIYERVLSQIPVPVEFELFDNPDKGIRAARQKHFNLIFINLNFWGTEYGYSILAHLQELCLNQPKFVAVTAFLQESDILKVRSQGFETIIEKPLFSATVELLLDCLGLTKPFVAKRPPGSI